MTQNAREKEGLFKGADALAVVTGSANEEDLYSKSAALQTWLLGYEFPDTCIVIGSRSITILTSPKKGTPHPSPSLLTCPQHGAHAPALCILTLYGSPPNSFFFVHRRSAGQLSLPA